MNVWKTGHEICDTVAQSLAVGFQTTAKHASSYQGEDCNIAYGILRGTGAIFRASSEWFNVDLGYFGPRHCDGYYRISYRGTQASYVAGLGRDIALKIEPWCNGITMICPPSPYVCEFYGIDAVAWLREAIAKCGDYVIKYKDGKPVSFDGIGKVITFNSSVGWQALQQGIIVDSHPEYSVVGSYYKYLGIDNDIDFLHSDREPLFRFMRAHQFRLSEIENGDAWPLIYHYLATSAGIHEKQSALT